jgi:hypothetical protein
MDPVLVNCRTGRLCSTLARPPPNVCRPEGCGFQLADWLGEEEEVNDATHPVAARCAALRVRPLDRRASSPFLMSNQPKR